MGRCFWERQSEFWFSVYFPGGVYNLNFARFIITYEALCYQNKSLRLFVTGLNFHGQLGRHLARKGLLDQSGKLLEVKNQFGQVAQRQPEDVQQIGKKHILVAFTVYSHGLIFLPNRFSELVVPAWRELKHGVRGRFCMTTKVTLTTMSEIPTHNKLVIEWFSSEVVKLLCSEKSRPRVKFMPKPEKGTDRLKLQWAVLTLRWFLVLKFGITWLRLRKSENKVCWTQMYW